MNVAYTLRQYEKAGRDVERVYDIAERRLGLGCIPISREAMVNAFQVLRYAMQEWGADKEEGVVLRMLNYREQRTREVGLNLSLEEIDVYCEDKGVAESVERILREDGYEEDSQ